MATASPANIDKVTAFIKEVPRGVKVSAMREIATYIIGDKNHGLRHDPRYKHITRAKAYPNAVITIGKKHKRKIRGYFSVKQFYWVILNIKQLGRKHDPTNYGQSWQMENDSHWDRVKIIGKLPFDRFPSNLNRLGGWRDYMEVVNTNIKGALQSAQRMVDKWLAEKAK